MGRQFRTLEERSQQLLKDILGGPGTASLRRAQGEHQHAPRCGTSQHGQHRYAAASPISAPSSPLRQHSSYSNKSSVLWPILDGNPRTGISTGDS